MTSEQYRRIMGMDMIREEQRQRELSPRNDPGRLLGIHSQHPLRIAAEESALLDADFEKLRREGWDG